MKRLNLPILLVAGAGILASGCVVRERTVYHEPGGAAVTTTSEMDVPDAPPPPLEVDTITIAPGPGFVWIAGAYAWHGHWVWEHGRWARPPRPGAVWVQHRYEYRNGHHVYVRGGWR